MKSALLYLQIGVGIAFSCGSVSSAGQPSREKPIRSEPVSLGDGDYVLTVGVDAKMILEHSSTTKKRSEWKVTPLEIKVDDQTRQDTWISKQRNIDVREIALARWSRSALIAVVKVTDGEDAAFWCLTFPNESYFATVTELSPSAAVLVRRTRHDKILALSGSRGSTITAVIGKHSMTTSGGLDSGAIIVNSCPDAGAFNSRVGLFRPEYSLDLDEKE